MFFTECERLAEQYPNLAVAIERIDGQLGKMGTAEVIRSDAWASFLGIELNQVTTVFQKLAQEELLRAEDMVECPYCDMVVLHSEYRELQEEDGEYRCTSCDRPLTDGDVNSVTTYRRGAKWKDAPLAKAASSGTSSPQPEGLDDNAWYTYDRLAVAFGVGKDALRKRLDRYRKSNLGDGWKEQTDRRPREPKYHYRLRTVRGIIEELRASSERPAKKHPARRVHSGTGSKASGTSTD